MARAQIAHIACAEYISLLSLLHEVPTLPHQNPSQSLPAFHRSSYTLPFDKERNLVDTLAFLSSVKHDRDHITAVCVEEKPGAGCLNVLVAINRSTHSDGDGILGDIQQGFEKIFHLLHEVLDKRNDAPNREDEVFRAIVSTCYSRILSRLGLVREAKKASKKTLKDGLLNAIDCVKRTEHITGMNSFVTTAKEVIKLFDQWVKHQTSTELGALVEGIYRLHQTGTVQDVLDKVLDRNMDPSLRKSVVNMVRKVARYREAARFLFRAARRFPLVRRMSVVPIKLSQESVEAMGSSNYESELISVISRAAPKYAKVRNLNQFWNLLEKNEAEAGNQFSALTQRTLQTGKIHAEIQLIFYCELHSSDSFKFPRVIASNKDACYLCNAFITMHGKLYTSQCHGRLYPGWRLPFFPELQDMQQGFNQFLEEKIRESLDTLFLRRQRTSYPFPNESTLQTLPISTSTLAHASYSEPCKSTLGSSGSSRGRRSSLMHPSSNLASGAPAIMMEDHRNSSIQDLDNSPAKHNKQSNCTVPSSSKSTSDHTASCGSLVPRGSVFTETIKCSEKVSPLYSNGLLEVQIEVDTTDPRRNTSSLKGLSYNIEWISLDSGQPTGKTCHPRCVIDAEFLQGETMHALCDQKSLYIAVRGSILKLTFY